MGGTSLLIYDPTTMKLEIYQDKVARSPFIVLRNPTGGAITLLSGVSGRMSVDLAQCTIGSFSDYEY
jgi:hypothetical protein